MYGGQTSLFFDNSLMNMNTPLQTRQQKHSLITKPLDSLLNIPVTSSIGNFNLSNLRGPSNYNPG